MLIRPGRLLLRRPPISPCLDLIFAGASGLDSRISFSRASTATYVNSSGVVATASTNTARFDYVLATLAARGLLIEPAATNLCLQSEDLSTGWNTNNATVTTNTTTAPDGNATADTLTMTGAAPGVYRAITVTASTTYTASWYAKLGTLAAADFKFAIYNATAGAFIASDQVPSPAPSSSAWIRLSYTFTTPVGCISVRVYPFRNFATVTGTVFLWGGQLELGQLATSYIPTTVATVTRAKDVAAVALSGFNFTSGSGALITTSEIDNTVADATNNQFAASISDGTNTSIISVMAQNGGAAATGCRGFTAVSGGGTFDTTGIGANAAGTRKLALNYATNAHAFVRDGGSATTSNSVGVPIGLTSLKLGADGTTAGAQQLNGRLSRLRLYPQPLSIPMLQALTR